VQAKFKGIPFVSQKAIYKEIIQNLTLTEPQPEPVHGAGEGASSVGGAAAECAAQPSATTAAPSCSDEAATESRGIVAAAGASCSTARARPASAPSAAEWHEELAAALSGSLTAQQQPHTAGAAGWAGCALPAARQSLSGVRGPVPARRGSGLGGAGGEAGKCNIM